VGVLGQAGASAAPGAFAAEERKGADKGVDGRIYFRDEGGGKVKQCHASGAWFT